MNDIVLHVNGTKITGQDIESAIDQIVINLQETGNLAFVEKALVSLRGIQRVSGMGIAKLLYSVKVWWKDTGQNELTNDTFEDWARDIDTGFNKLYIDRCVSIYGYEIDGTFSDRIKAQPIDQKQVIASHLDQGYEIAPDEWKQLERASDDKETSRIVREIQGKPPSIDLLRQWVERDGTMFYWKNGVQVNAGYLTPPDHANSDEEAQILREGHKRIFKRTGMSER